MIRIAIAEDDPQAAAEICGYIDDFSRETGQSLSTTVYPDGEKLVADYNAQYDILLLDVDMPVMDGMTAAQTIRRMDQAVVILFITNMPQYAIQGYAVDALDYVLKPLSSFSFKQRLQRALLRVKNRTVSFITISSKSGTMKIEAGDVSYVESQGHTLQYHTRNGDYQVSGTMQAAEEELVPLGFFRINKGCLVNLERVDGVQDNCVLIQQERIPLSRGRKAEFLQVLTDFIGGIRR